MKEKVLAILSELRPEFDFTEDVNYIEQGMLDSFDVVNLVQELESTFNITIDGLDILPENFETLDTILNLINSKTTN